MLDFLFPKKCIFCAQSMPLETELEICKACVQRIPFHTAKYLMESGRYSNLQGCDRVICALKYVDPVKDAMMRFKFFQQPEYAKTFAALLCEKIRRIERTDLINCVAYVPLNKNREKERGYNQAKLIAEHTAKYFHVPLMESLLKRDDIALRQSSLQKNERHVNIKNAFSIDPDQNGAIYCKTVLLIDDVATTLSTLNTCARVLKESGAGVVIGGVVASALMK